MALRGLDHWDTMTPLKRSFVLCLFLIFIVAPITIIIIDAIRPGPTVGYANPIDPWTIVHFGCGVIFGACLLAIGVKVTTTLPLVTLTGIMFEPIEHLAQSMKRLATDGGYEGWLNIWVDQWAVFFGAMLACLLIVFIRPDVFFDVDE